MGSGAPPPGAGTWMTTRVAPGRASMSDLNASIASTSRSGAAADANRTWRTVSGPASSGASDVAAATIVARASSGTAGSSSRSTASAERPGSVTYVGTGSAGAIRGKVPPGSDRVGDTNATGPPPDVGAPTATGTRSGRPGPTGTGVRRTPRPPRSPAATSRANASGPFATASSQSATTSARTETSSPLWSTRPATRRIAPSRQIGAVVSYRRGNTTTSIDPWRSSIVAMAIKACDFVTTIRTPV